MASLSYGFVNCETAAPAALEQTRPSFPLCYGIYLLLLLSPDLLGQWPLFLFVRKRFSLCLSPIYTNSSQSSTDRFVFSFSVDLSERGHSTFSITFGPLDCS